MIVANITIGTKYREDFRLLKGERGNIISRTGSSSENREKLYPNYLGNLKYLALT